MTWATRPDRARASSGVAHHPEVAASSASARGAAGVVQDGGFARLHHLVHRQHAVIARGERPERPPEQGWPLPPGPDSAEPSRARARARRNATRAARPRVSRASAHRVVEQRHEMVGREIVDHLRLPLAEACLVKLGVDLGVGRDQPCRASIRTPAGVSARREHGAAAPGPPGRRRLSAAAPSSRACARARDRTSARPRSARRRLSGSQNFSGMPAGRERFRHLDRPRAPPALQSCRIIDRLPPPPQDRSAFPVRHYCLPIFSFERHRQSGPATLDHRDHAGHRAALSFEMAELGVAGARRQPALQVVRAR